MAFSVGLLLKGLAGLGAASGAVSLGVIYGVDWDPHLLKLSFEERLKQKVGDFFGNKSSDKLCKKHESSDQNLAKYTCDATTKDTKLKEKLKFTTDGENELEIKNETLTGQKIEIRQNKDTKNFPYEIMLVLENVISPITLQEESGTKKEVTFKQKTNPEFKLENGKFKHAWTIENLGEMVNLDCKNGGSNQKTCTLKSGKTINVFENSNKKEKDVTFTGTLNWEEEQAEHNQGFKITVSSDIDLVGNNTNLKLLNSQSYEIKASESDNYTWYLAKKGCLA